MGSLEEKIIPTITANEDGRFIVQIKIGDVVVARVLCCIKELSYNMNTGASEVVIKATDMPFPTSAEKKV